MFFLKFLKTPAVRYLLVVLVVLAAGLGVYQWGRSVEKANQAEKTLQEIDQTNSLVQEGLNEFRKANPSRDALISIDRLRRRQLR